MTTKSATLRWPKPETIDLKRIAPSYDPLIDVLEPSFTPEPVPRTEVPLATPSAFTPLASVRDDENGDLAGEVVGIMVDNLSQAFATHPSWRMLAEGKFDQGVLASLIAAFSTLPEEADEDERARRPAES